MTPSLSQRAKTVIAVFLAASGILTALTIGLYVANFAGRSGYRVSPSAQAWAQFGDYLAGTLGVVFSLLAFLGVLCTVWLQATQLDLAGKQAALDEIQRVLATVSSRVDELLAEPVNHNFNDARLRAQPADFFRALSSGGTAALSIPSDDATRQTQLQQLIDECKAALAPRSGVIGIELDQLAWLINHYRENGGSGSVIEFYRRRYNAVVCWLDVLNFANALPHVQQEFSPEAFREVLATPPG